MSPASESAASGDISFDSLNLRAEVLAAVKAVGYETPSPIQAATIPLLLAGRDVLGQAQTGTGKTAAFALPVLSCLDVSKRRVQALVLTPTRELAIQVAEAMQTYASKLSGFQVLPIYGGADYRGQLQALKRGVQVIVGTPGRVMDHMRRGTLSLDSLSHLVLDEADEMLRMGFIDDVEWILSSVPEQRQIALFSATMPPAIRRIANTYLNEPEQVTIQTQTTTAVTIRQRFWLAKGMNKLDALTRILEAEPFDGMIIFVRTKVQTTELAEKLQARGFAAAPLNGDVAQAQRERTVDQLRSGKLDILVATDVVARGLDVERVSHVINYDIPNDTEAYVHRVGRTGRAGRSGDAILFVAPREKRMLYSIEKATRQSIQEMALPSAENINALRQDRFLQRIQEALQSRHLPAYQSLLADFAQREDVAPLDMAAALAILAQDDKPLFLTPEPSRQIADKGVTQRGVPGPVQCYRLEVGRDHGASAGNILGAIANETGLTGQAIGRIQLFRDFSTVELPADLGPELLEDLQSVWVAGQALRASVYEGGAAPDKGHRGKGRKPAHKAGAGKPGSAKGAGGKSPGTKSAARPAGQKKLASKAPASKSAPVKKKKPKSPAGDGFSPVTKAKRRPV